MDHMMKQSGYGKKAERSLSLKTKIMLSTLLPVCVSFVLIIVVILLTLNNFANQTAKSRFLQTSQKYAYNFEIRIGNSLNYLSILRSELENRVRLKDTDRVTLQKKIFDIFSNYGSLDGSSVYFDTNEYDRKDESFISKLNDEGKYMNPQNAYGTASSGRIAWYF